MTMLIGHEADKPIYPFKPELFAEVVETLIQYDEVERALLVLDNLPSFYRDEVPAQLQQLRSDIMSALVTPHAYLTSNLDAEVNTLLAGPTMMGSTRGKLVDAEVYTYNERGITPHVVDIGPGEYHWPIAMEQLGRKFTYKPLAMDGKAYSEAVRHLYRVMADASPQAPKIFLALEIIEHLPEPRDLVAEAHRHCGGWPERVHLSTPRYTFNAGVKAWRKPCGLPHLRAYTPNEFLSAAQTLFPGYHWQTYYVDAILSLRGIRADTMDVKDITDLLQNYR